MKMKEVYLDNAATTKPYPEVIEKMVDTLTINYGNPSSLHGKGLEAEKLIKQARENIASKLNVTPRNLYFTSGGTEANNLAIKGTVEALEKYGDRIITTCIEHPSVLKVFKRLESQGWDVKYLNVNNEGLINIKELKEYLTDDTILVSIIGVNNEIGSIQPLEKVGKLLSQYNNLHFHVDGVQTFTKVNIPPSKLNIDLYSISGHKIHGPKGIGALYIKPGTKINNILLGSKQESGIRPGTENVPGIVGFGEAAKLTPSQDQLQKMYELKELLVTKILEEIEGSTLNGPNIRSGAPHIANISFAGIKGEILVHSLEEDNIYVSTGAACSSKQDTPSYILENIGIDQTMIEGAIRFSLSIRTNEKEINYVVNKLKEKVIMLRKIIQR